MPSERDDRTIDPRRAAVIVPTRNAEQLLPGICEALAGLAVQPGKVLVIDSSSSDATTTVATSCGFDVHVIPQSAFGHGRTRNEAARLCDFFDFLVYLTQDARPLGDGWLEAMLAPFVDPQVALVFGRQLPRPSAGFSERYAREFNYPTSPDRTDADFLDVRGLRAVFCSNSFAAYRREALQSVSGFPEDLPMGEDMAVALRLLRRGFARVYQPEACAIHSHDYGLAEQFRRYFDIGALMTLDPDLSRLHASTSREGMLYLRSELTASWREERLRGMCGVLAKTFAKYLGYFIGRRHRLLTRPLCEKMSMHGYYWRQQ